MDIEMLARRWREDAKSLRLRGADSQAVVLESCVRELEEHDRHASLEELTLDEAATESGYTYTTIQKMLATGRLLNVGRRHRPRVRRGDLPKKGRLRDANQGEPDLVAQVLAG